MEALKKKFKSRRGASLLLAMLFLMVCMMVGASVMIAAAFNLNKFRGVQEEQQKYLTLSSALNLLVDELERVEYVGKYEYTLTMVILTDDDGEPIFDGDGNPIYHYIHTYEQVAGELRLSVDQSDWGLNEVLPLYSYFDSVFAWESGEFDETEYIHPITGDQYFYKTDISSVSLPLHYKLELELTDEDGAYGGLSDKVSIDVELREDGSIYLTATLEETDYKMIALLKANLDYEHNEYPQNRLVLRGDEVDTKTYETKLPIRWNLEYIFKGEAAGE